MEVSKTDADGQVIGTSYWERVDIGFNVFFRLIQEYAELKDMKKILFILGSLRAKSFNRQVANVAKEIIGERADGKKDEARRLMADVGRLEMV